MWTPIANMGWAKMWGALPGPTPPRRTWSPRCRRVHLSPRLRAANVDSRCEVSEDGWTRGAWYRTRLPREDAGGALRGAPAPHECGGGDVVPDLDGLDRGPLPNDPIARGILFYWAWAEQDSCRLVISHQTLEHLRNLIPVMEEVWRICQADAFFEVVVPYGAGKPALQDPTHVRFFTETTFRYWEPGFVEDFGDYGILSHFAICGQGWREDGNLWTLLHPIKTG